MSTEHHSEFHPTHSKSSDSDSNPNDEIRQPLAPEQISLEQLRAQKKAAQTIDSTLNPGDRVDSEKSLEEKAQQVAVNVADITGEHVTIPTYFIVEDENGDRQALHHVKDAEEISDVIRQARTDGSGDRQWW